MPNIPTRKFVNISCVLEPRLASQVEGDNDMGDPYLENMKGGVSIGQIKDPILDIQNN